MAKPDEIGSFEEVCRAASRVAELRLSAWKRLQDRLGWPFAESLPGRLMAMRRVLVLASSSRGGTSVTAELLQWQGADCDRPSGRVISLPGEEKPHLVLSGLAYPTRPQLYDDLEADDVDQRVHVLLEEMASEAGYPTPACTDLELYATQLYRRLLLQWPLWMVELEQSRTIGILTQGLTKVFGAAYHDSVAGRRRVLACVADCFPFIRRSFYDCWPEKSSADAQLLLQGAWSLEEPPFVLPPPWHNATRHDLEEGTLLLRDPSNAWRLAFWRGVLPRPEMLVLHLTRPVEESIQGLCDGWNYPFGFQTLPSREPLCVAGYSEGDHNGEHRWRRHRLNFSVDRSLSRVLLEEQRPMTLIEACGHQWRAAHERILRESGRLRLSRIPVSFLGLRSNPPDSLMRICSAADLEMSRSGLNYADSFQSRWVMATVIAPGLSHARWRQSPYASEIREIAGRREFSSLSRRLASPPEPARHLEGEGDETRLLPQALLGSLPCVSA